MDLTFLGTRGEIEKKTQRHRCHSALLVSRADARILLDCGGDWRGRVAALRPNAIVLTHGHPDHAAGLKDGAPCPVYATAEAWHVVTMYPITEHRVMPPREPIDVNGIVFEAFPVEHSIRAPAVRYRITADRRSVFYVPDVAAIGDLAAALDAVDLYIGDGATITRSMIRRRDGLRIGHTPIKTQLDWCREKGVPRAIFTHCGSHIVGGDERVLDALIRRLGRERGVEARIAYDGMKLSLDEHVPDGSWA